MMNTTYLMNEVRAWLKRVQGPDEVVRILLDLECKDAVLAYLIYTAYDEEPDYLGRILFDAQGYWIYDGQILSINEQEQLAKFIVNYQESL